MQKRILITGALLYILIGSAALIATDNPCESYEKPVGSWNESCNASGSNSCCWGTTSTACADPVTDKTYWNCLGGGRQISDGGCGNGRSYVSTSKNMTDCWTCSLWNNDGELECQTLTATITLRGTTHHIGKLPYRYYIDISYYSDSPYITIGPAGVILVTAPQGTPVAVVFEIPSSLDLRFFTGAEIQGINWLRKTDATGQTISNNSDFPAAVVFGGGKKVRFADERDELQHGWQLSLVFEDSENNPIGETEPTVYNSSRGQ